MAYNVTIVKLLRVSGSARHLADGRLLGKTIGGCPPLGKNDDMNAPSRADKAGLPQNPSPHDNLDQILDHCE